MGGDAQPQIISQLLARLLRSRPGPGHAPSARPRLALDAPGRPAPSASGGARTSPCWWRRTRPAAWPEGLAGRGHRCRPSAPSTRWPSAARRSSPPSATGRRPRCLVAASDPRSPDRRRGGPVTDRSTGRPAARGTPLRIASLAKQIPLAESLRLEDGRLVRAGVALEMNPYCRRAVAQGVTLARETGGSCTVLTLGPAERRGRAARGGRLGGGLRAAPLRPRLRRLRHAGHRPRPGRRPAAARALRPRAARPQLPRRRDRPGRPRAGRAARPPLRQRGAPARGPGRPAPPRARARRRHRRTSRSRCRPSSRWPSACATRARSTRRAGPPSPGRASRRVGRGPTSVPGRGARRAARPSSVRSSPMEHDRALRRARRAGRTSRSSEAVRLLDAHAGPSARRDRCARAAGGGRAPALRPRAAPPSSPCSPSRVVPQAGRRAASAAAVRLGRRGRGGGARSCGRRSRTRRRTAPRAGAPAGRRRRRRARRITACPRTSPTRSAAYVGEEPPVGVPRPEHGVRARGRRPRRRRHRRRPGGRRRRPAVRRRHAGRRQAGLRRCARGRHHLPERRPRWPRSGPGVLPAAPAAPAAGTDLPRRPRRHVGPARAACAILGERRNDDVETLARAEVVIGVGTGVAPDEYEASSPLAAVLGAELAATRKVTDKGWAPRARQVGITGRSIAPRLYIALGLSGKFNHMVGVRAAGTILAVNARPRRARVRALRHRDRRRLARGRAAAAAGARRRRRPRHGAPRQLTADPGGGAHASPRPPRWRRRARARPPRRRPSRTARRPAGRCRR